MKEKVVENINLIQLTLDYPILHNPTYSIFDGSLFIISRYLNHKNNFLAKEKLNVANILELVVLIQNQILQKNLTQMEIFLMLVKLVILVLVFVKSS